jgi:hypothetical protein
MGRVEVGDTEGKTWSLDGNAQPGAQAMLSAVSREGHGPGRGSVAVFLDLLPTRSDAAFDSFAAGRADDFSSVLHLRPRQDGNLVPADAAALVGEAAHQIRQLAGDRPTTDVHVLLRCPWPVALLLGRTLNTLRVHHYEWEDGPADDGSPSEPRYLPSLIVRSGRGGSPIEQVLLPARLAV